MQPYVVELPESEFFTCHDLALAVARSMEPKAPEERLTQPYVRASWTPPSPTMPTEPAPDARLGPPELIGKYEVRRVLPALLTNVWRPLTSEHLLVECARRLVDLQAWVVRKELSVFTASQTKAPVVAPGAYLRRVDAIRYCEESGLNVKGQSQPAAPAPAPIRAASTARSSSSLDNKDTPSPAAMPAPAPSRPSTRLLRTKEAIARTGLSRSSFYERLNPNSPYFDATFPNPVQIGQSAMGYREDELDTWIASRPQKER